LFNELQEQVMTITGLRTFDHSLATTKEWLKDVQEEMGLSDMQQAFEITRAVLQTLRDRLTVEEAAHFASQLPMLLQGVYYHDWMPAGKPLKIRTRQQFFEMVAEKMMGKYPPEEATKAVLYVLERRMSPGEMEDIKSMMPSDIKELWC
jgi:uncharacterized protein (DUF2267 family)